MFRSIEISSQIETVLEGFKLGSLGISKKPKVTYDVPDEKRHVKEIKWIDDKIVKSNFWVLGVTWEEGDFKFYADFVEEGSNQYNGIFMGGRDLVVKLPGEDEDRRPPEVEEEEFRSYTASVPLTTMEGAKHALQTLMSTIEREGSFATALVSGKLGKGWHINGEVFFVYVEEMMGVKTTLTRSPYFYVGT